jgi:hypothetical protein
VTAIDRAIDRLPALFWVLVFAAAALLTIDTATTIVNVGLIGDRSPLSVSQTGLRIALMVSALGLMFVRRNRLERITLLSGAAAAGSSAIYGFGLRSAGLSAFRLLSHLILYALATLVAGRMFSGNRRKNG